VPTGIGSLTCPPGGLAWDAISSYDNRKIRSMTGYAAAAGDSPRGTLSLELRSVKRALPRICSSVRRSAALEPMAAAS